MNNKDRLWIVMTILATAGNLFFYGLRGDPVTLVVAILGCVSAIALLYVD
jgi:hypothetical protein